MTAVQKIEYSSIVSEVQKLRSMRKEALLDKNTYDLQRRIQKLYSALSPKEDGQAIMRLKSLYKSFDDFGDVCGDYEVGVNTFIRALSNFR